MQIYLVLLAVVLVGCAFGGLLFLMRQRQVEHRKIADYTRNPGGEPPSIVCPKCARRTYSASAIRDRYCPSCRSHHDAPAAPLRSSPAPE